MSQTEISTLLRFSCSLQKPIGGYHARGANMKMSIAFFAVIFFSFLSLAADQKCSQVGEGAQNSCITAKEYTQKKYEETIAPSYTPAKPDPKPTPAAVAPKAATPAPQQPIAAVQVNDLKTCLQKWDQKANACLASAQTAKKSCDQKNSESGIGDVQKYTDGITNSTVNQNAGKGSVAECAKVSLFGNTAINGLNAFKEICEDDFATCSSDCSEVVSASEGPIIANECLDLAKTDEERNEVVNTIMKIISASRSGRNICMVEAKAEKDIFDQLMATIGKSTQAAKVCACNFSSNGNCESIPNPKDCLPGAASAGSAACNVFANDNCALGSPQFSSIPCQCARDSSAAVCRTAAAVPLSNFALDLKPSPGGVTAGVAGVADSGSGNLNLSGGYNLNKPVPELKADDKDKTSGGGYAGGNGSASGAGGGSSAAGGSGDPAALVDEDGSSKTGLAGLFNQVKSSFGNNKSGSNKNTKAAGYRGGKSNGSNSDYDLDKWRPRGPANANCNISQLRCKNEDIFLIMNKRYDVIGMSFILSP